MILTTKKRRLLIAQVPSQTCFYDSSSEESSGADNGSSSQIMHSNVVNQQSSVDSVTSGRMRMFPEVERNPVVTTMTPLLCYILTGRK